MEKIDFLQATQDTPITKEELMKKIISIPIDIALDYVQTLESVKNRLERTITIFHSMNGPFFDELVDRLNEDELKALNKTTELLNDENVLNNAEDLGRLMGNAQLIDNGEKANELLDLIKDLGEDGMKKFAEKIVPFSQDMRRLAKLLLFYLEKEGDEEAIFNRLKATDAQDLVNMITDFKTFIHILKGDLEANQA